MFKFLLYIASIFGSGLMATQPDYLYKVISLENWAQSQDRADLKLASMDDEFVHFSLESQLDGVISRYWNDVPEFVVLKIDPNHLVGSLVFETNPGGSSRYYHLYEGKVPLSSVLEVKVVTR